MRLSLTATRGESLDDPFKIGVSTTANFFPYYLFCKSVRMWDQGILKYHKKVATSINNVVGRYDNLFYSLFNSMLFDRFEFIYADNVEHIFVMKHCILDKGQNILLMMTCDRPEFFKEERFPEEVMGQDGIFTDMSLFKLFVSTDLINEEKYTNVWKKIEKDYVSVCYKDKIRVEFTTSENRGRSVSNPFSVGFEDVGELMHHLSNDVTPLLLQSIIEPANTRIRSVHEPVVEIDEPFVPIPMPVPEEQSDSQQGVGSLEIANAQDNSIVVSGGTTNVTVSSNVQYDTVQNNTTFDIVDDTQPEMVTPISDTDGPPF